MNIYTDLWLYRVFIVGAVYCALCNLQFGLSFDVRNMRCEKFREREEEFHLTVGWEWE